MVVVIAAAVLLNLMSLHHHHYLPLIGVVAVLCLAAAGADEHDSSSRADGRPPVSSAETVAANDDDVDDLVFNAVDSRSIMVAMRRHSPDFRRGLLADRSHRSMMTTTTWSVNTLPPTTIMRQTARLVFAPVMTLSTLSLTIRSVSCLRFSSR